MDSCCSRSRKKGRSQWGRTACATVSDLLILLLLFIGLAGCSAVNYPADIIDSAGATESSDISAVSVPPVTKLSDLQNTENFAEGALEHIFEGTVNARGVASGYHYEGVLSARGSVVSGTETKTDAQGVYEARITVDGVKKSGNNGYSTFFPSAWTPQEVVDAILEAYENRGFVTGNTWRGESRNVSILMYLDEENRIISAFPEYGGK